MAKVVVSMLIGIAVMFYSQVTQDSTFVVRGTEVNYGYFLIAYGVIMLIFRMLATDSASSDLKDG